MKISRIDPENEALRALLRLGDPAGDGGEPSDADWALMRRSLRIASEQATDAPGSGPLSWLRWAGAAGALAAAVLVAWTLVRPFHSGGGSDVPERLPTSGPIDATNRGQGVAPANPGEAGLTPPRMERDGAVAANDANRHQQERHASLPRDARSPLRDGGRPSGTSRRGILETASAAGPVGDSQETSSRVEVAQLRTPSDEDRAPELGARTPRAQAADPETGGRQARRTLRIEFVTPGGTRILWSLDPEARI